MTYRERLAEAVREDDIDFIIDRCCPPDKPLSVNIACPKGMTCRECWDRKIEELPKEPEND